MSDHDPLKQLTYAIQRVATNTRTENLAATAYAQALTAQAAIQAVIDILRNQNVISEDALRRALNHNYDLHFQRLSGANGAQPTPAPQVKQ